MYLKGIKLLLLQEQHNQVPITIMYLKQFSYFKVTTVCKSLTQGFISVVKMG